MAFLVMVLNQYSIAPLQMNMEPTKWGPSILEIPLNMEGLGVSCQEERPKQTQLRHLRGWPKQRREMRTVASLRETSKHEWGWSVHPGNSRIRDIQGFVWCFLALTPVPIKFKKRDRRRQGQATFWPELASLACKT